MKSFFVCNTSRRKLGRLMFFRAYVRRFSLKNCANFSQKKSRACLYEDWKNFSEFFNFLSSKRSINVCTWTYEHVLTEFQIK